MPTIEKSLMTRLPTEINQPANDKLVKRKGGGGGGARGSSGGGGGGRSGSSGSSGSGRTGSSGSSGSGRSGSGSGSSGSGRTGSSGSSGSGRSAPATYHTVPKGIAPDNWGSIFGAGYRHPTIVTGPTFGYGRGYGYGYGQPLINVEPPPYGWWPIYWDTDSTQPHAAPNPEGRQGGPLTTVALAPNGTTGTNGTRQPEFIFTADQASVDAVVDDLMACGFVNVTVPSDLSNNVTVQSYRWDSAVLAQLGVKVANSAAIPCLNSSIGANLPVVGAGASLTPATSHAALLGLAVVLYHMF